MLKNKWVKIPYTIFLYAFAIVGFGLTTAYFAIQFKWTNEKGSVDVNSRYLNYVDEKYSTQKNNDSIYLANLKNEILNRIVILNRFYPKNAQQILTVLEKSNNVIEVSKMLDVTDIALKKDNYYQQEIKKIKYNLKTISRSKSNAIEWMNMSEWEDFKIAVAKDEKLIDSVSRLTGVEERLIVSCLVGEQIRLFNSDREAYKRWIGPLKILSVESQFSLGVTGIKEFTAQQMETHLKDSSSIYYLGDKYKHLLDFKTDDKQSERFKRLTSFRNHFYSYLYAAIFVKQMKVQWDRKGFPIDDRPEILATLFNVGYPQSKPNKAPKVGGSTIMIKNKAYTFGIIAHQFYYSGELNHLFPIKNKKFDWDEV
jgi:hypothetical protein